MDRYERVEQAEEIDETVTSENNLLDRTQLKKCISSDDILKSNNDAGNGSVFIVQVQRIVLML